MKALRRAAFTWKFRTHLAKRAFRPVSSRSRFERRGFTAAYIKGDPSNQLRETSLASLLGKLHPRTLRGLLLHSCLSIPFFTPCSPFRSQYLFYLDRSSCSLIPHSDSRYIITGDRSDTSRGGHGERGVRSEFRNAVAAANNVRLNIQASASTSRDSHNSKAIVSRAFLKSVVYLKAALRGIEVEIPNAITSFACIRLGW